ncbi:MAG: M48 family peptidase [Bacteroidetes bacterium]|nr:MAG: M48 family peptidase [Bacteroidota bacterium]REK00026.1 MAG: M48 family peptidase [Bacteroidota bacterium]REK35793.1 MAG: M48 family peptidase [Bacteroidota bacterium]REK49334.1 MAG: M48 family peptidase [Bacteroidota bacterium]
MHYLLIIILAIVCADFLLGRLLDYLNNTHIKKELPSAAHGIYDENKYHKFLQYYRARNGFSQITSIFGFIITAILLVSGAFGALDEWLRTFTENPIWLAILFFGVIGLASDIISTPFSVYSTFVIEEKFGFNKTTVRTFIADKLKAYVLAALVGGGLLALLTWIYLSTGTLFWLLAWGTLTLVMIFITAFYTSVLLPVFNKLKPLPEGELRSAIEEYARKNDFRLDDIYVMDGSKRTSRANAFFSGLGKRKKIVLFDTLIEKHTVPELVAVLAHETGHFKLKHTRTGLFAGILQSGIMFYLLGSLLGNPDLTLAMGGTEPAFHLDLLAFGLLYSPVSLLLGIFMNMLSRKHEYEADRFASSTYDGQELASALKKLSVDNLSNLNPHPAYVFVHYSHPPLLSRLAALKK